MTSAVDDFIETSRPHATGVGSHPDEIDRDEEVTAELRDVLTDGLAA